MRRSRAALVVVLVALALVAAACSKKSGYNFPDHPPKVDPDESTTVPDYSSVRLAAVPGRTTTTIDNTPGRASMSGTVMAPDGAVPGATVHVERLVDDAVLALDIATNPDGTWRLDTIKGGRYRIRAWRAPDLALTTPLIFFLNGDEKKTNLTLLVNRFTGTNVSGAVAPNPPHVDEPSNLVVQVTTVVVDPTGVVRATPMPNVQVDLQGSSSWRTDTSATGFTDVNGQVFWRMTCLASGSQPLSASVNGQGYALNLPSCVEASAPAPEATPPSPSDQTTTTRRQTTTTRR
jgi:hypothetical protein